MAQGFERTSLTTPPNLILKQVSNTLPIMKAPLILLGACALLASCDARVNVPPAEGDKTTVVTPPATKEEKSTTTTTTPSGTSSTTTTEKK